MGKHGPARNKPQSLKKDLGKKPQKGRSGGTKSEPVCRLCGSRGHYTSTCPRLAQKLLQAVRKSADSKDISDFLATNAVVRVQGLKGKPQRTAKKASGKRQKTIAWKKARLVSSSKRQRKKQSKKNAARDKQRRPKSMKTSQSRVGITFKASQSAYNSLLKSQWVWKEKQCACGQAFDTVPWKTCMRRGFGRLFVRCYTCGCYSAFFQM